MKNMTLRGLDPELAATIKQAAERDGKSVNQTALDALRKQFGLDKKKPFTTRHNDLDHLFGRWSEDEFDRIQRRIDSGREIDGELWQ